MGQLFRAVTRPYTQSRYGSTHCFRRVDISAALKHVRIAPPKSAVDLRRIIHEARDNLCAVTCPVLCVQSSGDQVITPDSADVILQGVRSKTKGVLRLESVPHVCTISREGGHIAQALGTFFRKVEESERT